MSLTHLTSVALLALIATGCMAQAGAGSEAGDKFLDHRPLRECDFLLRTVEGRPDGDCSKGCVVTVTTVVDSSEELWTEIGLQPPMVTGRMVGGGDVDGSTVSVRIERAEGAGGGFSRRKVIARVAFPAMFSPLEEYLVDFPQAQWMPVVSADEDWLDSDQGRGDKICPQLGAYDVTMSITRDGYDPFARDAVGFHAPIERFTSSPIVYGTDERSDYSQLYVHVRRRAEEEPDVALLVRAHVEDEPQAGYLQLRPLIVSHTDEWASRYLFDLASLDPFNNALCLLDPGESETTEGVYSFHLIVDGEVRYESRPSPDADYMLRYPTPDTCD